MARSKIVVCVRCSIREIAIKKRSLCYPCYQELYRNGKIGKSRSLTTGHGKKSREIKERREMNFVKNYFTHSEWIHHPASFLLGEHTYTPDFYDKKKNIFIEVVGSQQAYQANKFKYKLFSECFPLLTLIFMDQQGTTIVTDRFSRVEWSIYDVNDVET